MNTATLTLRFQTCCRLAALITLGGWIGVGCWQTQAEEAAKPVGRPAEARADDGHPSPPMGWNSYTGYSIAVTEKELLKNIDFLSENLLQYGYDTVTVDNGWFLSGKGKGITIALDKYGRPESHEHFFPRGLKYTTDYAHKKGVKFGIWLLRGINRRAVEENLPVEGTKYRMQDIVNMKCRCPWAVAPWWNYGVDMTRPGAQKYYDGVAFFRYEQTAAGQSTVNLATVKPLRQTGEVSIDRSPEKGPLDLGDVVYATGIGVRAGSELTYDVSKRDGRFEAWAGIDPNVSAQRSGGFYVYADGDLVFDSGVIDQAAKRGSTQNPTRPIRVVVPLAGVEKLRLTFQCEDDKDKAGLCGGWGDAKLVPASAPEYETGKYERTTLAQTPPMGWNSWCRYGTGINEELIKKVADAMVDSGMRDAGYVYVNLDDGWQASGAKFDDQGYPLWDTEEFPSGMKALGDYLHAKGLKFGIYSRAGWVRGHEMQFAERFAEWGVDLVKYDFSNKQQQKATLDAIRAAGRDVVFSVCEWGRERPWLWAPGFNAEMWRTTYDVKDKWTSTYDNNGGIGVLRSAHQNEALGLFVGPGRWNDMDMLQIGVDGFDYGHDRKKAGFDITPDEERFQMSLWSILASPLLAANDVTTMNDHTKSILLNKQVIAVNQDPLGVPGWRVKKMDQIEVWKRPLTGGDIAVVFVNLDDKPRDIDVTWAQLNVRGPREVSDLWEHRRLGRHDELLKFEAVPSHGVVFVRLSK